MINLGQTSEKDLTGTAEQKYSENRIPSPFGEG